MSKERESRQGVYRKARSRRKPASRLECRVHAVRGRHPARSVRDHRADRRRAGWARSTAPATRGSIATVAIKVLTGALAADSESRQRFEQEARVIAALNDPHICTIHDVGRHGELDYLVLEYLEGETLADRLRRTPELPVDDALDIAIQIGDALDRAHRAGIVHRDLKPGNVMLVRRSGRVERPDVKLLDFGLAARTAVARPPALDASMTATMAPSIDGHAAADHDAASGFSGTVQYMAPEQLDGRRRATSVSTSSRSAACSTRCSPAGRRSRASAS